MTATLELTTDEELFNKVQGGDQEAYGQLYQRYDAKLRKRIRRSHRLCSSSLDDVMQDVWLQVYSCNKEVTNFGGYVLAVAIHQAGKRLESRRRDKRQSEQLRQFDVRDEVSLSYEDRVIATETEAAVFEAMRNLPKDIRQAVRLIAFFNLSESRVAYEMKISRTTLRRRLEEARDYLKEQIV